MKFARPLQADECLLCPYMDSMVDNKLHLDAELLSLGLTAC